MPSSDPPTDFLDELGSRLSLTEEFVMGSILVAFGVALVRLLGRWVARAHPETLKPQLGADLATLLVGMGTFVFGLSFAAMWLDPNVLEATDLAALKAPMLANAAAMSLAALATVVSLRARKIGPEVLGLVARDPLRSVGFGVLTYIAIWPAFSGSTFLEDALMRLIGASHDAQKAVQGLASDPALRSDTTFLVLVVLVVPILEEVLFRGVLLGCLLRVVKWPSLAIALGAGMFAIVHDAGRFPVFVLGCAMGWLYWRTRDLLAPITLHVAHNSFVVWALIQNSGESP